MFDDQHADRPSPCRAVFLGGRQKRGAVMRRHVGIGAVDLWIVEEASTMVVWRWPAPG